MINSAKIEYSIQKKKKILFIIGIAVFIVSLIPILYVARYDHATGDDYAFGAITRQTWLETHSILGILKEACLKVREIYDSWQGTWLSVFLFTLQPEIFSFHAYCIVPYIMLPVLTGAVLVFAHHFLAVRAEWSSHAAITAGLIASFMMIQFVPSKSFAYYWWNGSIHYTVPFSLALLAIVSLDCYLETGRMRYLAGLTILQMMLGGMSYPAAVMMPLSAVFIILMQVLRKAPAVTIKRIVWLLIPAGLELMGLFISAKAPGNKVRGGSGFGFHFIYAVQVICRCLLTGITTGINYLKIYPLLLVFFVIFVSILIMAVGTRLNKKNTNHCRPVHPVLVGIAVFLIYASGFSPELYASVSVSEGVGNTYFFTFIVGMCAVLAYSTYYVMYVMACREEREQSTGDESDKETGHEKTGNHKRVYDKDRHYRKIMAAGIVLMLLYIVVFRRNLKQTADYICYSFVVDGRAARFESEIELQDKLLTENSETDPVLPMTNGYDGPIMHMPITEDAEAWTNQKTAQFYGKASVTGMKREDWIELYGDEIDD